MRSFFTRFPGFVLAGVSATALNLAIFYLLISSGLHHSLAAAIGYFSGTGLAYLVNRVIAFRPDSVVRFAVLRYFLVDTVALLVLLLALEGLVSLGISPAVANPIAVFTVFLLKYVAVSRLVFLGDVAKSRSAD